jgi:hypothetical protein
LRPYYPHRGSPEKRAQPTQGKLFRDPKPTDEARYPRGYTPERMQEVRGMPIEIHEGYEGAFSGPEGPRQVREVIARSTTPAHELPHDQGDLQISLGHDMPTAKGAYGYSFRGIGKIRLDVGHHYGVNRWFWNQNQMRQGQTLMHELGHARSDVEKRPHSYPRTQTQLGQEEAFADENMLQRWRPDPRDVRRGESYGPTPSYEHEDTFEGLTPPGAKRQTPAGQAGKAAKTAHRAYLKARTTPLVHLQHERLVHEILHSPQQLPLQNQQFGPTEWGLKQKGANASP